MEAFAKTFGNIFPRLLWAMALLILTKLHSQYFSDNNSNICLHLDPWLDFAPNTNNKNTKWVNLE